MNEPQKTLCDVYNLTSMQAERVSNFFKGYYEEEIKSFDNPIVPTHAVRVWIDLPDGNRICKEKIDGIWTVIGVKQ